MNPCSWWRGGHHWGIWRAATINREGVGIYSGQYRWCLTCGKEEARTLK